MLKRKGNENAKEPKGNGRQKRKAANAAKRNGGKERRKKREERLLEWPRKVKGKEKKNWRF